MATFLQGIIAGGTISYLSRKADERAESCSSKTYELVALQANHLLVLVGTVLIQVGIRSTLFGLFAKSMLVVTPIVVFAGILRAQSPLNAVHKLVATYLTRVYMVSAAICSLALFILGNYAFGVSVLSILALKVALQREKLSPKWNERFAAASGVATVLCCVSYVTWTMLGQSTVAKLALLATGVGFAISCFYGASSQPMNASPPGGLPLPPVDPPVPVIGAAAPVSAGIPQRLATPIPSQQSIPPQPPRYHDQPPSQRYHDQPPSQFELPSSPQQFGSFLQPTPKFTSSWSLQPSYSNHYGFHQSPFLTAPSQPLPLPMPTTTHSTAPTFSLSRLLTQFSPPPSFLT